VAFEVTLVVAGKLTHLPFSSRCTRTVVFAAMPVVLPVKETLAHALAVDLSDLMLIVGAAATLEETWALCPAVGAAEA
jgi:hypothetical protein